MSRELPSEKQLVVAQRFNQLIKDSTLNGKSTAEALSAKESLVSMWRNAQRPIPPFFWYKIADLFDVPLSFLLGEDEQSEVETLGRNIEKIRKSKDIDYITFAKMTHIKPIELSQIERGLRKPSPEELKIISEVLNIDPDDFKVDYKKHIEIIKHQCKQLGVSDRTIDAVISEIELEVFQ